MTQVEIHEGSVVDLVARIARERGLAEGEGDGDRDRLGAKPQPAAIVRSSESPKLLFPGAPRRAMRAR